MDIFLRYPGASELAEAQEYTLLSGVCFGFDGDLLPEHSVMVSMMRLTQLTLVRLPEGKAQDAFRLASTLLDAGVDASKTIFVLPSGAEGLRAARLLREHELQTGLCEVPSSPVAMLAARSGCTVICTPLPDASLAEDDPRRNVPTEILQVISYYEYPSRLLITGIQSAQELHAVMLGGVHAAAVSWAALKEIIQSR